MRDRLRVHVLLVEDDTAIATPLAKGLQREGLTVTRVGTGIGALELLPTVDLVLLDLGLPDIDGYEVCRQIRATSTVPIIVVTARGEEVDRVIGLELGADDYVVKPFGLRELIARIRAVTRRTVGASGGGDPDVRTIGPLVIDRRTHRATLDAEALELTPKEFDLLAFLASDPGRTRSRREILEEVWDPHWYGPSKTLDVHMASLRKKLGDPGWVETVRGVGFRLRDDA
jgi:two-component system response regulator RegX3